MNTQYVGTPSALSLEDQKKQERLTRTVYICVSTFFLLFFIAAMSSKIFKRMEQVNFLHSTELRLLILSVACFIAVASFLVSKTTHITRGRGEYMFNKYRKLAMLMTFSLLFSLFMFFLICVKLMGPIGVIIFVCAVVLIYNIFVII